MAERKSTWQTAHLADAFLQNVRGAIPGAQTQLDLIATIAQRWQPAPRRIVDLGCGDGVLGRLLLALYPEADVWFADFSPPMLDAARRRLGAEPRAHLVQADFGEMGWTHALAPAWPADIVVSGFSIHHQPDAEKQRIYGQIHDQLAPGGLFLNLEHCAPATAANGALFDAVFIDHLVAFNTRSGSTRTAEQIAHDYYYRPDMVENILSRVELQCDWLRAIGYQDVDIYYKFLELALFGGRRAGAPPES